MAYEYSLCIDSGDMIVGMTVSEHRIFEGDFATVRFYDENGNPATESGRVVTVLEEEILLDIPSGLMSGI